MRKEESEVERRERQVATEKTTEKWLPCGAAVCFAALAALPSEEGRWSSAAALDTAVEEFSTCCACRCCCTRPPSAATVTERTTLLLLLLVLVSLIVVPDGQCSGRVREKKKCSLLKRGFSFSSLSLSLSAQELQASPRPLQQYRQTQLSE